MFEIFEIEIWTFFFSFSVTWDPMEVKISKRYSYKSQPNVLKTFPDFFFSQWSSLNYFGELWNFEFPIFNDFFRKFPIQLWGYEKPQLSGKRAILEQNGMKFETMDSTWYLGTFVQIYKC